MGIFGWDLPPGVTTSMLPGNQIAYCDVCGKIDDACVCPECSTCSSIGDPVCYKEHGLKLNREQVIAREESKIDILQEQIQDSLLYIEWLRENPKNFESIDLPGGYYDK
jgi:hypothetical protein